MHYSTNQIKEFIPITIANGDGSGPEIMESVLRILMEASARIRIESIEVGQRLYEKNYISGISEDALQSIARTGIILKAPITRPAGNNYKDLSDTLKDAMSLYANMVFFTSYPIISNNQKINSVIISNNQTQNYDKLIKFSFEFALKNNFTKILCLLEDNKEDLNKIFHNSFLEISTGYKQIISTVVINEAFKVSDSFLFDIIITTKPYKKTLIDNISKIILFPIISYSADIGDYYSLFAVCHNANLEIADLDIVNPSCLLHSANNMLKHIGQSDIASVIERAWSRTIEYGIHTYDIYNKDISTKQVGTKEFTREIIKRIRN